MGQYAALKALVKGDGCTSAPDLWFHRACMEHDADYAIKIDEFDRPITRLQADNRFLTNMRKDAPNWIIRNTLPFLYYAAVRIFGFAYWRDS